MHDVDELPQVRAQGLVDAALSGCREGLGVGVAGGGASGRALEGVEAIEQRADGHDRAGTAARLEAREHQLVLLRVQALERGVDAAEARLVPVVVEIARRKMSARAGVS